MDEAGTNQGDSPRERPELVAPAGDRVCARAAVENGADAVYFGLATPTGFNARARATNVPPDELPELIEWLHRRGVKGYVALNTLVFGDELDEVEALVRRIAESGADAVLVQDFGVARLARAVCPELPLHASTQMSLTSAEGMRVAESLGVRRIVLARELSIEQIRMIRRQTGLELEAFVHGALCVSYSGQCLASFALGGRSANRGQCAQACRMPYELVCDGRDVDLGDKRYLLSPHDLAAWDLVPELIRTGVSAMKIEGRLKGPEYVACVTGLYRRAIDAAMAGQPPGFTSGETRQLEVLFSRGLGHGWLEGPSHKTLVWGHSSAKRGIVLGEVLGAGRGRVRVRLAAPVCRGDGVVFEGDRARGAEQGGRVWEVFVQGRSIKEEVTEGVVELSFARGSIRFGAIQPGQRIYKTHDPRLDRRLRQTFTGRPTRKVALDLAVEAAAGRRLVVAGRAASGAACRVESPEPLAEAHKHPLTAETLREHLGRLGATPYALGRLDAKIEGRPMAPLSVLGKVRRAMVEQLEAALAAPPRRQIAAQSPLAELRAAARTPCATACPPASSADAGAEARLHVLCRSLEQLEQVLASGVRSVIADLRESGQHRDAVRSARAGGAAILLATPRVQKPGEIDALRPLADLQPDGILARNLGALGFFRDLGVPVVADFSLNAANELSVAWLLQQGAARVTACCELGRKRLVALAKAVAPGRLEVVIHHHLPMFHTEHCLFCAVLSPGTSRADCGRPCDRHGLWLRDHVGVEHPLAPEAGCRNTMYRAEPQSAAELVPGLVALGVRDFRVELCEDTPAEGVLCLIRMPPGKAGG